MVSGNIFPFLLGIEIHWILLERVTDKVALIASLNAFIGLRVEITRIRQWLEVSEFEDPLQVLKSSAFFWVEPSAKMCYINSIPCPEAWATA